MRKTLIAKKDKRIVKQFLLESETTRSNLNYHSITGFLYGLAMTPGNIEPNEWLRYIVEDQKPAEHTGQIIEGLVRILDNHVRSFKENQLPFPFDLAHMLENNGEIDPLVNWVKGLIDAFYFRSSFWDGEALSAFDADRQRLLFHSMLMLEGIVEPETVQEVFEKLPTEVLQQVYPTLDLNSDTVDRQIIMICVMSCQEAVEVLQQFAWDVQQMQKEQSAHAEKKPAGEMIKVNFAGKGKKV